MTPSDCGSPPWASTPSRTSAWVCRSCACITRQPYHYPPSAWAYCGRCGGALSVEEQLVAVARLRLEGALPDLAGLAPMQKPAEAARSSAASPLMSVKDVAALLNTTRGAVYAMHARRKLPGATKVGRRVLFRRDALLRWLAEGEPRR